MDEETVDALQDDGDRGGEEGALFVKMKRLTVPANNTSCWSAQEMALIVKAAESEKSVIDMHRQYNKLMCLDMEIPVRSYFAFKNKVKRLSSSRT